MFGDIFLFLTSDSSNVIAIITVGIVLYGWISLFKNKDYKSVREYNRKYANRVLSSKDIINIRHEIKQMEGREFEYFCEWLFKRIGKYKSVILTRTENDEGRDLILVDEENDTVFVECKRYTDSATINEDFMIGREICQKLIGAMVVDNIEKGIIITTGNIHKNAWNYITKLERNTDITIDILTLDDIMRMIQEINSAEVLNVVGLRC